MCYLNSESKVKIEKSEVLYFLLNFNLFTISIFQKYIEIDKK